MCLWKTGLDLPDVPLVQAAPVVLLVLVVVLVLVVQLVVLVLVVLQGRMQLLLPRGRWRLWHWPRSWPQLRAQTLLRA